MRKEWQLEKIGQAWTGTPINSNPSSTPLYSIHTSTYTMASLPHSTRTKLKSLSLDNHETHTK